MNSPVNDYLVAEDEAGHRDHIVQAGAQAPNTIPGEDTIGYRRPVTLLRSWVGWIMLLLIVGGGGAYLAATGHGNRPATASSRISYIEGIIRCPDVDSCGGTIPVSDTNAPVAIEIKDAISADVHAGMNTSEIKHLLVARYGPGILLSPSASGLGLLLWLLPVIAGICVITILSVVLFRRSRGRQGVYITSQADNADTSVNAVDATDAVVDGAGTSTEEGTGREGTGTGRRGIILHFARKHPKALLAGGISCIVAAVAIAAFSSLHTRLQGEVATGNISLSKAQEIQRRLVQASAAENSGNDMTSLKLYNDILAVDPNQVQALSESGWITYETGVLTGSSRLMEDGEARVKKAMNISPGSFTPHLYLGTIYLHQGNASRAAVQYREFLKDNPPKAVKADAGSFMKQAFTKQPASP